MESQGKTSACRALQERSQQRGRGRRTVISIASPTSNFGMGSRMCASLIAMHSSAPRFTEVITSLALHASVGATVKTTNAHARRQVRAVPKPFKRVLELQLPRRRRAGADGEPVARRRGGGGRGSHERRGMRDSRCWRRDGKAPLCRAKTPRQCCRHVSLREHVNGAVFLARCSAQFARGHGSGCGGRRRNPPPTRRVPPALVHIPRG